MSRVNGDALRVVIVTWNSGREIPELAQSLRRAGVTDDQVVLVDNASSDDTLERVHDSLVDATVLSTGRNAGYGAAINLALGSIDPEARVLVLNPDTRLHPDTVTRLLRTAMLPAAGVIAPSLHDERGRRATSARRDPTWWRTAAEAILGGTTAGRLGLGELIVPPPAVPVDVDWVTGAAMLITPAARRAVPTWEASYFLYSEEVDFCQRVRDHGLRVILEPRAQVMHSGGDMTIDDRLWALRAVNRVLHSRRRDEPVTAWLFHGASLLFELRRSMSGDRPARAASRALLAKDLVRVRDELLPSDVDAALREEVPVVISLPTRGMSVPRGLNALAHDADPGEFSLCPVVDAGSAVEGIQRSQASLPRWHGRPVLYIDSRTGLTHLGARRLIRLVRQQGIDVALPVLRHDTRQASSAVRSYLRVWAALAEDDLVTEARGAVAFSDTMRDRFVRGQQALPADRPPTSVPAPRERRRLADDVVVTATAPVNVCALVRAMTDDGTDPRAPRVPHDGRRLVTKVVAALRSRPWLVRDLPPFLWVLWRYSRRQQADARNAAG